MALKKEKALANMYLDLMAHDINNLNQVVIGNLEIAIAKLQSEKPGNQEILDYLEKSLDTMSQQTALINNVKTLQQLKTEQLRYDNVDLGEIVAKAVKDYPKVPGRNVAIEFNKPDQCIVRTNGLLRRSLR